MENKLKPCPKCGGEPKLCSELICWGHGDFSRRYFVVCTKCRKRASAKKEYCMTEKESAARAVEKWNKRTEVKDGI